MKEKGSVFSGTKNRRSFLKKGVLGVGAAAVGAGLLAKESPAFSQDWEGGSLTRGDVAILQLLLAAEIIETDLWQQYKELGGVEAVANNPVVQPYVNGLQQLDLDMPQYISDNTDDEISHVAFLRAYLKSKGHDPINLDKFAHNLAPSTVSGVPQTGRLTNLKQLSVDTSWWTRYRSKETLDLGAPAF